MKVTEITQEQFDTTRDVLEALAAHYKETEPYAVNEIAAYRNAAECLPDAEAFES